MFCLLTELTNCDVGKLIAEYMVFTTPFILGRAHQLVMDKSDESCLFGWNKYVLSSRLAKSSTKKIIHEAVTLARKYPMYRNESDDLFSVFHVDWSFNKGRYFQFLLDQGSKYCSEVLLSGKIDIKQKALKRLTMMLKPEEGQVYDHRFCDCELWTIGDNRCSCNSVKLYLEQHLCESLDDTGPKIEVCRW